HGDRTGCGGRGEGSRARRRRRRIGHARRTCSSRRSGSPHRRPMAAGRPLLGRGAHRARGRWRTRRMVRETRNVVPGAGATRAARHDDDAHRGQRMVETTADVRRDIELTRERLSSTLDELEQKLNVAQVVRDHPWPALALALGAGVLLSGSGADMKAAAATVGATKGASSKLADVVASLLTGVHSALNDRVTSWVDELKGAIGAPMSTGRVESPIADRAD